MAETTHHGSCHCGAVSYSVDLDLAAPAVACNCSICQRAGTVLAFVPTGKFHLERGDDQLTSYKFNRNVIDHVFCKTCGIKSFARGKARDGSDVIAVNLRTLDGVDLEKLTVKHFDGKAL
jgi:hypothetical protein